MSLLQQIGERANLERAVKHVAKRVRMLKLERHSADAIAGIERRLQRDDFRLHPVNVRFLRKKSGGKRPISSFHISDRIILRAALQILWPILEPKIIPTIAYCTFRKDGIHDVRGVKAAIRDFARFRSSGKPIVLRLDIKSFYDRVDRELLLNKLAANLADESAVPILRAIVNLRPSRLARTVPGYETLLSHGLPQGAATSSLLACIFLEDFDNRALTDKLSLVRYVDDIAIACGSIDEAKELHGRIGSRLNEYGLELNEGKTVIAGSEVDIAFLGSRIMGDGNVRAGFAGIDRLVTRVENTLIGTRPENLPAATRSRLVAWVMAQVNPCPEDEDLVIDRICGVLSRYGVMTIENQEQVVNEFKNVFAELREIRLSN